MPCRAIYYSRLGLVQLSWFQSHHGLGETMPSTQSPCGLVRLHQSRPGLIWIGIQSISQVRPMKNSGLSIFSVRLSPFWILIQDLEFFYYP
jgi:hypothetical protein